MLGLQIWLANVTLQCKQFNLDKIESTHSRFALHFNSNRNLDLFTAKGET